MKYIPAKGARLSKTDAQVIGERLEFLEKRDGFYTPETVAKDGRNAKSPIHRFFEGKEKGYALYLIERARDLIESIRISIPESGEPVRASQSVRIDDGPIFVNTERVLADDALRLQCVERGIRALRTWVRMFGFYPELKVAADQIATIIDGFSSEDVQERQAS